jgi:hypothetical protein
MENFNIQEELKKLPGKPGVYLMHDEKDAIIYVGKAISLKNRVRQYFQSSRNKGAKIEQMVTHISRFEYIVTDSELEALVLECNLIKEHRPKYNTMLMDDKSYPFIKVTVNEPFPRVMLARQMKLFQYFQCYIHLPPSAVHHDQIRKYLKASGFTFFLLFTQSMPESSGQYFIHTGIIIRTLHSFNFEFAVIVPFWFPMFIDYHRSDRIESVRIGNIICLHAYDAF